MKWITIPDLERWAKTKAAEGQLPELIRRLICASQYKVTAVRFPAGESTNRAGWDGELRAEGGPPYVPSGASVWELSTEAGVASKARSDFEKRSGPDSPPLMFAGEKKDVTYVALTTGRWPTTGKLENRAPAFLKWARESKVWKDVQVIELDMLATWLEEHPAVGRWFAVEILGIAPAGAEPLERFWSRYSGQTRPPLSSEVMLAGRGSLDQQVVEKWSEPEQSIKLQADSAEEAAAFAIASVMSRPVDDPIRLSILARGLVISTITDAQYIEAAKYPMCLVLVGEAIQSAAALMSKGHSVILALGNSFSTHPKSDTPIRLPRARREQFAEALSNSPGVDADEARRIAADCNGSVTIYRRLLDQHALVLPSWATPKELPRYVGPILAGAWLPAWEGDKEILGEISGVNHGDIEHAIREGLIADDPPLQEVAGVVTLNSPIDALSLVIRQRLVTGAVLERFKASAHKVLGERDPALDLPVGDRPFASLHGKKWQYSGWMRRGIAEVIRVLASGEAIPDREFRGNDVARDILASLDGLDSDYRLWASLGTLLPSLMEAAPDVFIGALTRLLARDDPGMAPIFHANEDPLGGYPLHVGLLHGLELVAASPDWFIPACDCLLGLARIDNPSAKLSNRPLNSLVQILLPWRPGTHASVAHRVNAIQRIARAGDEVSWKVVEKLLPGKTGIAFGDVVSTSLGRPKNPDADSYWELSETIVREALRMAGGNAARWKSILAALSHCHEQLRAEMISALEIQVGSIGGHERDSLWRTIRDFSNHHRTYADAAWALDDATLARLERVSASLLPVEEWKKSLWLFDQMMPEVRFRKNDFEGKVSEVARLREEAILSVYAQSGLDGVVCLSREAKSSSSVASAVARTMSPEVAGDYVRIAASSADDLGKLGPWAVVDGLSVHGWEWLENLIKELRGQCPPGRIAELLRFLPTSAETIQYVESLGADVALNYWALREPWFPDCGKETVKDSIKKMLPLGRAAELLSYCESNSRDFESKELLELLDQTLKDLNSGEYGVNKVSDYAVTEILEAVRKRGDVAIEEIAKREFSFLPMLIAPGGDCGPLSLLDALKDDPELFVELIKSAYYRDDQVREADQEGSKIPPDYAHHLLSAFRVPPGTDADGKIDGEKLASWIQRALAAAEKCNRKGSAAREIGEVLAYAPKDPGDGIWPAVEVRAVLEMADENMAEGFLREAASRYSLSTRGVYEGGNQERVRAAEYRQWSAALLEAWPGTARLLARNADFWESAGRRHDADAERRKLQFDR